MSSQGPPNAEIANKLEEIADLLEAQDANQYRVRAYRNGANSVRESDQRISKMVSKGGKSELTSIPDIGDSLANVIIDYVDKGRSSVLDRLKGESNPKELFTEVSGIGGQTAERIRDNYDIESLGELEEAAYDGRLEQLEGIGEKKLDIIRDSLSGKLSRSRQRHKEKMKRSVTDPSVELLLDVDREYREKAEKDKLKKITPKRFNPDNEAWLPILHTERGTWNFTVLFSNTQRAHELGKTHDWVVIYYEKEGRDEDQCTVVTETKGSLEGKRVVRGREEECRKYYR